jgi:two-component system response regulator (stage 0 sporulation protein A)
MSDLEKKVSAIMRLLLADDPADLEAARKHLRTIAGASPSLEEPHTKDVDTLVRDFLFEIGAPDHLVGYQLAVHSVCYVIEDPSCLNKSASRLFQPLAELHNTSPGCFGSAICRLIDIIFERGDIDLLDKYFGATINPKKGKPTNAAFIARVANIVKARMDE